MVLEKGMEIILPQTGTATRNLQSCEDSHTLGGAYLATDRLSSHLSLLDLDPGSFWRLIRCDVFVDKTSGSVVVGESEVFTVSYCDQHGADLFFPKNSLTKLPVQTLGLSALIVRS